MLLRPVLRFAALRAGIHLGELPDNPLEGIPPAAIAEILAVMCVGCAAPRALPRLAVG